MQAWDSVKVRADVELGGTEQLYSFMLARDLQRDQNMPQQIGMMTPILVGLDGVRRMGKSLGNYIGIGESAYDMMKKFMQVPDAVMRMYFELLTDVPLPEVDRLLAGHPKDAKLTLARHVISGYHPAAQAEEAAERWQREISQKELPAEIPEVVVPASAIVEGRVPAARLLQVTGLSPSSSEARRLISQGGVSLGEDKVRVEGHDTPISVTSGLLLWVGKKRVVRLTIGDK
jgi:tyrosyl-tRNA synthetase